MWVCVCLGAVGLSATTQAAATNCSYKLQQALDRCGSGGGTSALPMQL